MRTKYTVRLHGTVQFDGVLWRQVKVIFVVDPQRHCYHHDPQKIPSQ